MARLRIQEREPAETCWWCYGHDYDAPFSPPADFVLLSDETVLLEWPSDDPDERLTVTLDDWQGRS